MQQKILFLAFIFVMSISHSKAHPTFVDHDFGELRRAVKPMMKRLANNLDVETFFQQSQLNSPPPLKREYGCYIPRNFAKIEKIGDGERYKMYNRLSKNQPLVDVFTPRIERLSDSNALQTEDDIDELRIDEACKVYDNFVAQQFSGFFDIFKHNTQSSFYNWRFDFYLKKVLQQVVGQSKYQNDYGRVYLPLPDFVEVSN